MNITNHSLSMRAPVALGFCAAGIFLLLSLLSYNPTDPSWFYYMSGDALTHNWCGPLGAHLAAFLFYFFGAAAYFFVPLFGVRAYSSWQGRPVISFIERIMACIIGFLCVSGLLSVYGMVLGSGYIAGGVVGLLIKYSLYQWIDHVGTLLVLYALLAASICILFHYWLLVLAHGMLVGLQALSAHAVAHQWGSRLVATGYWAACVAVRPLVGIKNLMRSLVDGSLLHQTGLMVPDEYAQEQSPCEQEQCVMIVQQIEPAYADRHDAPHANVPVLQPVARAVQHGAVKEVAVNPARTQQEVAAPASYTVPDVSLFGSPKIEKKDSSYKKELVERAAALTVKLERFGIKGKVVAIKAGPVITLFEYEPEIDTKLSKIIALEDDLSMALQALSIRILAPIPGRSVVGFEVANAQRKDVLFSSVIQSPAYLKSGCLLPLVLGEDTVGNNVVVDLARMPHLLIAGSTGSGKSVALNAMLISLLCRLRPDELRLILIDPKRLEFATYADIAHLLFPIVTDPKQAGPVLRWVVGQMEERYKKMALKGVRSIADYNQTMRADGGQPLPYIVVIIDELADLMMTAGREVEDLITRITQMARAAGIHMMVATQRPSVDVITGLIKVNFPSRISFRVTSKVDSRTILDCVGADKLLGRGDMLFMDSTNATVSRVHGAYVTDAQIAQVVNHIRSQQPPQYLNLADEFVRDQSAMQEGDEELYQEIISFLQTIDEVSISLLQRKFRIGYNRSARIIDMLEHQGMVISTDGGKMRKVVR